MIVFIYKIFRKISHFFERQYTLSKLGFINNKARSSCIVDENVKILNPNVILGENVHLFANVIIW